jgi:hypothetical protein
MRTIESMKNARDEIDPIGGKIQESRRFGAAPHVAGFIRQMGQRSKTPVLICLMRRSHDVGNRDPRKEGDKRTGTTYSML